MIASDSTIRAGFTAISGYPIRGATDISHIAERGVISYEAENYDFHRDTREDRCNRRIAQRADQRRRRVDSLRDWRMLTGRDPRSCHGERDLRDPSRR